MQYREIVAVTGLGGLFHLLNTKSDGAIVRSLADNTTRFISSRQHNVTPLDTIEIYTMGANVRLQEVLQKMKDSSTAKPDVKKAKDGDIRGYFREVYPDMDEERVYTSDMKKMLKWFEILQAADLLNFPAEVDETTPAGDAASMPAEGTAQVAENSKDNADMPLVEEGEEASVKKPRTKKSADGEENGEPKAVKKAAAKKKAADGETETPPKKAAKAKKKEGE